MKYELLEHAWVGMPPPNIVWWSINCWEFKNPF